MALAGVTKLDPAYVGGSCVVQYMKSLTQARGVHPGCKSRSAAIEQYSMFGTVIPRKAVVIYLRGAAARRRDAKVIHFG